MRVGLTLPLKPREHKAKIAKKHKKLLRLHQHDRPQTIHRNDKIRKQGNNTSER